MLKGDKTREVPHDQFQSSPFHLISILCSSSTTLHNRLPPTHPYKNSRLFFSPTNHEIGPSVKNNKRKKRCVYLQDKGIQPESCNFSTEKQQQ